MKLVVLLQLGTPDALDEKSVKRFLKEFLMDPKVITTPWILRYFIVNFIIVPRRTKKVIKRYELIWSEKDGSPLRYHGDTLTEMLNESLPNGYHCLHAMRYGEPSIRTVLAGIEKYQAEEIIFVPLLAQEADATTGSMRAEVEKSLSIKTSDVKIKWLPALQEDERYLQLMARALQEKNARDFDWVLFSFHGLPLKQIEYDHKGSSCLELKCSDLNIPRDTSCYTRDCYASAEKIARLAGIDPDKYTVAFQSRFGKKWIGPQSEDILKAMANKGESVLVIAPSFLTDCLETSWEIGISFKEMFMDEGGKHFDWVPSLNTKRSWAESLREI